MTNKLHLHQLQSIKLKSPLTYLVKGLGKCQMNMGMLWKTSSELSVKILAGMFENETERNLSRVFKRERDWYRSLHWKHGWRKENHQLAFPSVNNSEIENKHVVLSEFIISEQTLWSCILLHSRIHGVKVSNTELNMKRGKFTWMKTVILAWRIDILATNVVWRSKIYFNILSSENFSSTTHAALHWERKGLNSMKFQKVQTVF